MSKPAWTPGPWVFGSDGQRPAIRATAEAYEIATVHRWVPPFDDSYEANARLIAEAPAMAEALECLAAMAAHFPTVKTYGTRPRSGAIYSVSDMHLGEAAITVEDLHRAAAILARINGEAG